MEADVNEVACYAQDHRHGHGTHRDESGIMLFEEIEDFGVQPGGVTKFDGVSVSLRQLAKKYVQSGRVLAQHRRQLPKNRARMFLQGRDALKKNGDGFGFDV